jgi:hypothetical protein
MDKPNYYAIIPAGVRYSEIKPNAKLLYGEITALTNKKGYCFASNNYFAELYNVNKNTISLWIKELKDFGFIYVELKYKDKQIIERRIAITILNEGYHEKRGGGVIKKGEDNNTRINNTSIPIIERRILFEELVFQVDDVADDIKKEFCNYWTENNPSKTKLKFEMEKTWDMNKRLNRWINNSKKWEKTSYSSKKFPSVSKLESTITAHQRAKEMITKMNNNTNE